MNKKLKNNIRINKTIIEQFLKNPLNIDKNKPFFLWHLIENNPQTGENN